MVEEGVQVTVLCLEIPRVPHPCPGFLNSSTSCYSFTSFRWCVQPPPQDTTQTQWRLLISAKFESYLLPSFRSRQGIFVIIGLRKCFVLMVGKERAGRSTRMLRRWIKELGKRTFARSVTASRALFCAPHAMTCWRLSALGTI